MILDEQTKRAISDENHNKAMRLDTRQHCLKILQGLGKFDDNTAHRAIWELVQNARDCAEPRKGVHIRIELRPDSLLFAHNGKHFDYDSLCSLIKQVSSEEKDDTEKAGQFGTGFMTTHKFGRILHINGSYEVAPGIYVPLEQFRIDRSADTLSDMRQAMESQLREVNGLLDKETTPERAGWTEFVYLTDTPERQEAARKGVEAATALMPYVMTINTLIRQCTITGTDGTSVTFRKQPMPDEAGLHVMRIWKNGKYTDCHYLQSADGKDMVILPLKSPTEAMPIGNVPRLFIFFPLLGTEINSINYIYHSERFFPTEPRDNIVLPDGNSEHRTKAETDVQVLAEMSHMLFAWLKEHAGTIKNSIHLAPIGFDMAVRNDRTIEFLEERHKAWVEVFRTLPLIGTDGAHVSIDGPGHIRVPDHTITEFLRQDGNIRYLDVVYEFASAVAPMPARHEVLEWSEIIHRWNPDNAGWFITIEDIVGSITAMHDKARLKEFLLYLRDSGQTAYFNTKAIIPNREGKLYSSSALRDGAVITPDLYKVCRPLVPEFTSMLVDEDFAALHEFATISRDDLKTALGTFVDSQEHSAHPYSGILSDVLRFCLTFPTANPVKNDRYKAMQVICGHYPEVPFNALHVPHLGDVDKEQLLYKTVFDWLVKYEFRRIQTEADHDSRWMDNEENRSYLLNLLTSLSDTERPTSYQTKIMPDYTIFPNRNVQLCKSSELYILEQDAAHPFTDNDIRDLCRCCLEVTGVDKRRTWVDAAFAPFQPFAVEKAKTIANSIDEALKEKDYTPGVTIDIIGHIDKGEDIWKYWFSNINDNKAQIFLSRIKNPGHRANVYALMKTDEKRLDTLARLATNDLMDRIIEEGRKVIAQEQYQQRHDCFIKELGDYAESILLDELKGTIDNDRIGLKICDRQGGQDYVVTLDGEDIYYIEVKSRWSTSDVVEMSPLQFRTAVDHSDCYSLCFVDMTWKNTSDIGEREYADIQTCLGHTKVLNDIGQRSRWCLSSVQDTKERPHIGGSYSLSVPQELFRSADAVTFRELVERIKDIIKEKISHRKISAKVFEN
ncbi:MAG: hypothetical protein Q4F07_00190 [Bacteroidales bacterium]|nr:hypothetical protein [Bacteroidales bacterium]